jgi:hypothetical protein
MSFEILTPTSSNLLKALINGKTAQLEHILAQRDLSSGVPVVDINRLRPSRSSEDQTAFRVALYSTLFFEVSQETRSKMATCILDVVDLQGNTVMELNQRDSQGDTILEQIEKASQVNKLYKSDARTLTSRILNLREANGSRAFQPSLNELIRMRDLADQEGNNFLVHLIDDLRNADGTHVIPTTCPPQPVRNATRTAQDHEPQLSYDLHNAGGEPVTPTVLSPQSERNATRTAQEREPQLSYDLHNAGGAPVTPTVLSPQSERNATRTAQERERQLFYDLFNAGGAPAIPTVRWAQSERNATRTAQERERQFLHDLCSEHNATRTAQERERQLSYDLCNAWFAPATPTVRWLQSEHNATRTVPVHQPQPFNGFRNAEVTPVIPTVRQSQLELSAVQIARARQTQPLSTGPRELQIFHNNSQNVHNAPVEQSVLRSLISLCKKYFSVEEFSEGWASIYADVFDATFEEIKNYVSESARVDERLIEKALNFIRNHSYSHASTHLSLKQILCLIWIAAADSAALCPPNPHMDSVTLTRLRKEAVLDRIFDAEIVYEHGRSCSGGYVNNLVAALSQAHECVNILLVDSGALSSATDSLNFWILQKIRKSPLELQKAILSSWDEIGDDSDNAASSFHKDPLHIQEMFNKLETNYNLSETLKNQIRDAWYSLPRPALHQELSQLMNQIFSMYVPEGQDSLFLFDQSFQSFAKKAIQKSCSFQEAYEQIKEEYEIYLEIRKPLAFLNNFSEFFSESLSLKVLESTIKNLDQLSTISFVREEIFAEIAIVKRELKEILLAVVRTARWKNTLMLFLPIIGWAVLIYRFFTKKTSFFPIPSSEKIALL